MTDRESSPSADELADAVADLGETQEDQLSTVDERNASLEERLPDDALPTSATRAPADTPTDTPSDAPSDALGDTPADSPEAGSPEQG